MIEGIVSRLLERDWQSELDQGIVPVGPTPSRVSE